MRPPQLLLPLVLASEACCSPLHVRKHAVIVDHVSDLKAGYDYVVIGGGTSGLTVADRLTEDPESTSPSISCRFCACAHCFPLHKASVLVVEYGPLYHHHTPPIKGDVEYAS
jgi:hypothetical protein